MNIRNGLPAFLKWLVGILFTLLVLMALFRILFFISYREGSEFSWPVFFLGLRFDLRIIGFIGIGALLLSFLPKFDPYLNPGVRKIWFWMWAVVFFLFLVFYASDYYHYDYLQQRLNASVINFLEDAAISFGMMWETYPLITIFLLLVVLLAGFYLFTSATYKRVVAQKLTKRRRFFTKAIALLVFGLFAFGQVGQYPLRWSDAFRFGDNFKANVALNPFQSFFSTMKFRRSTYDVNKAREYYPVMAEYLGIKNGEPLSYSRGVGFKDTITPNIILVICESFSMAKSTMGGNRLDPTPYFNSLTTRGLFFERCFTPSFGTARGVWAVITGIPDVEAPKTASRNPSAVDQKTIINDLQDYRKYYFLGGSTTWANIRGVLTNNINNLEIFEQDDFSSGQEDVWGISDKNLFLEAIKIINRKQGPFFSIIQTANNHRPYTIPAEDVDEFKKVKFDDDTLSKYQFQGNDELNAFRYMDFCIEKFMSEARRQPWYDNTLFVFVGDHGLRSAAGNNFPESYTTHGIAAQHVPLLFYGKGVNPRKISNVCSQLDVMPTIASLAMQSYTNTTLGVDLTDSLQKRVAFISDPDLHTIGCVSDSFYFRRNLHTGTRDFVSVVGGVNTEGMDVHRRWLEQLTEAFYETSRYLLFNNKKSTR